MDRMTDEDLRDLGPVAVETWYDRHIRSWVSILVTEHGEQVGSAMFDGTKADRDASIKSLRNLLNRLIGVI